MTSEMNLIRFYSASLLQSYFKQQTDAREKLLSEASVYAKPVRPSFSHHSTFLSTATFETRRSVVDLCTSEYDLQIAVVENSLHPNPAPNEESVVGIIHS